MSTRRLLQPWALIWILLALLSAGCAAPKHLVSTRPFVFRQDTFAFPNEIKWEYHVDPATGKAIHHQRQPPPSYSLHCFVVSRSTCQFFRYARFDPAQPIADEEVYRRLIRRVVSVNPRRELPDQDRIIIPGYENLYSFSAAHPSLLKAECGGAWQSYFQRGHWRMIFPFTRRHQEKMAENLFGSLQQNAPAIAHAVRFPQLSINHAIVLFAGQKSEKEIQFSAYDPNVPDKPITLTFNRAERCFLFPASDYFIGGRVNVYQVYRDWDY